MKTPTLGLLPLAALWLGACAPAPSPGPVPSSLIQPTGKQKPVDSKLRVRVGETAPDFTLPAVSGRRVSLASYRGRKNVILSFVPAAFTPVCSAQWPGYHLASGIFDKHDAVMLGITTDNLPSLHAWTSLMGNLGFEVLSDFWPHGKVSQSFGVLRSDGTTERALILIDKQGVIRWIDVHDINVRPPIEELAAALGKL
jgi:peroxiredoxin (alkyl hydroperoxide reductase subunit C)